MASQTPPFVIQASSHSAELFRRALQTLVVAGGIVTNTAGTGDMKVTQNGTPDMHVLVAAGQCWMPGTQGSAVGMGAGQTSQGMYYGYQDASVTLPVPAADATNPRLDRVVATVQDAQYSGAANTWLLQYLTGTPAPSPVLPALPANSISLAQVSVAALQASVTNGNITNLRTTFNAQTARASVWSVSGSVPNGGLQTITFGNVVADPGSNYNTTTGLFTCPINGIYGVAATITWQTPPAVGVTTVSIMKNAAEYKRGVQIPLAALVNPSVSVASFGVACVAGDTISVATIQTSGGALNTLGGAPFDWMDIHLLSVA